MKIFFNMRKSILRKEKFTKIFFIYRTYEQILIFKKGILEKKNPTHTCFFKIFYQIIGNRYGIT